MNKRRVYTVQLCACLLIALFVSSCSSTKYVPEGEYLLDKVKIESDVTTYNESELKRYIRQQPNHKMFGLYKTMLMVYNLSGRDSSKWHNRFIRKIGEEPVIFDASMVDKTSNEFRKFLVNKGYINAVVTPKIDPNNKKVEVTYQITGNEPYRIREYTHQIEDKEIEDELLTRSNTNVQALVKDSLTLPYSLVQKGMLFDRNVLNNERDRIVSLLHNRGYYAFAKDYISYNADSTLNQNAVDLELYLRLHRQVQPDGSVTTVPHKKYYFDQVNVYLDYDPLSMTGTEGYSESKRTDLGGYRFYYLGNHPSIRPKVLLNNIFINQGNRYSQSSENSTYSAFSSLDALSNIHILFDETQRNDSMLLNCNILAIPARKQGVSFSVEGTNTTGDLGIATSANYTHRNLFRGSEVFNFRVRGAYEAISNSNTSVTDPYLEYGAETGITVPKFIFPFISNNFLRQKRTSTEFSLAYNYQTRPEFDRTLLSGGIHYSWQSRYAFATRHQFNLLDIDYVYLPRIQDEFMNNLPSSARYFGYENQFIVGMGYTFHKTTYDPLQKQRNAHSLRFSIESAGNALNLACNVLDVAPDERGSYQLFGTHFAQFVKADFDYAKTIVLDKQNAIAWRIGGGVGIPFGNSQMLPFEKRYYSGGANSVRGWSVRELGPGSYQPNGETTFFNQTGDIKLDLNLEYRTRFFWKLEAAAFIDAGNIWTIRNYTGQEGGQFKLDSFYKEIAMSYGLGLRLDFDFFLIRFDMGMKAYDPARRGSDCWAITHPNFKTDFAWHIAVGYPF